MKSVFAAAAAAAVCAAAPALALAQDNTGGVDGAYGNLGWSHVTTNGASTEGIQGRLGYRFMPYLGVEGELRAGLSTGNTTVTYTSGTPPVTGTINSDVKQTVAGAGYVVGFLPLMSNRFDLLARVGYGWSRYNLTPTGLATTHADENGIRYGVGAQYLFDGKNGVRVDWTREHMNNFTVPAGVAIDNNANVWGVSFVHRF
jgi:opacity protein-like surface antigen